MAELKKITEGMTGAEAAKIIYENDSYLLKEIGGVGLISLGEEVFETKEKARDSVSYEQRRVGLTIKYFLKDVGCVVETHTRLDTGDWLGNLSWEDVITEKILNDLANPFSEIGYVNKNHGNVSTDNDFFRSTNHVLLDKNRDLIINGANKMNVSICCFFDKEYNFISPATAPENTGQILFIKKEDFPEKAHYIRCTCTIDRWRLSSVSHYAVSGILKDNAEKNKKLLNNDKKLNAEINEEIRSTAGSPFVLNDVFVNKLSGQLTAQQDCYATEFITLNKDGDIKLTGYSTGNIALITFYGPEKNFISAIFPNEAAPFYTDFVVKKEDIPVEAVYIRASAHKNQLPNAYIKNKSFVSIEKENKDISFYTNGLKEQRSTAVFDKVLNYGKSNGMYSLAADFNGRISLKGTILVDMNDEDRETKIAELLYFGKSYDEMAISLLHAKPQQGMSSNSGEEDSNVACARLRSGFKSNDKTLFYDRFQRSWPENGTRNNLCGDKMIMLWYKGRDIVAKGESIKDSDISNVPINAGNYFTEEELKQRSEYLADKTDVYVSIENNTFTIGRDSTGVIFQTSLKNGNVWKKTIDFYNELVPKTTNDEAPHNPIPVLSDFYINFVNLQDQQTTESFMQCGKIYLVGEYRQNLNIDFNFGAEKPYTMECDSFPFFIYNKINLQEHIFDVILESDYINIYINGSLILKKTRKGVVGKGFTFKFGSESREIIFSDLEVYKNCFGDIEYRDMHRTLVSERTPVVVGLIGHNIYDTYAGSGHDLYNTGMSISNIYRKFGNFKNKGYTSVTASEFIDWKLGVKPLPAKKCILFIADDRQILRYMDNYRIRRSFDKVGLKITFAQILRYFGVTSFPTPELSDVQRAKDAGHDVISHTRFHNEPVWTKPSANLWIELIESEYYIKKYSLTKSFAYNRAGGEFVPQQDILDYFGYLICFGGSVSGERYSKLVSNNFNICRVDASDMSDIDGI